MSRLIRLVVIVLAAGFAGALITYAVIRPQPKESDEAAAGEKRVSIVNGEPTITLDEATQQKIGLATTPVRPAQQAEELQLFGTVIDVQELAALENQAAQARAQADQARARTIADEAELARLRTLNADNKNVSDRMVQEAAAALAADKAASASADASLRAASSTTVQKFGPVVAEAVTTRSPMYQDLLAFRQMLVEVSTPPGTVAPKSLTVTAADGSTLSARLLAPAPRVDPRLQGATYFYLAPGGKLPAGMNVVAHYASPRASSGVLVPSAAVVSFEGKSWLYVRRDATHFARHEISIDAPSPGGFFVSNVPVGSELVTTGAQQLLSEEMRAQLHEE